MVGRFVTQQLRQLPRMGEFHRASTRSVSPVDSLRPECGDERAAFGAANAGEVHPGADARYLAFAVAWSVGLRGQEAELLEDWLDM